MVLDPVLADGAREYLDQRFTMSQRHDDVSRHCGEDSNGEEIVGRLKFTAHKSILGGVSGEQEPL